MNSTRFNNSGFTLVEMIVGTAILILIVSVIYLTISYYSSSFLRIDDRLEKNTEAWRVVQAIQEDILAANVPQGDNSRWEESIKETSDGFMVNRKIKGEDSVVTYSWDKSDKSLSRAISGKSRVLIKNLCQEFKVKPEFKKESEEKPPVSVWVIIEIRLEEPVDNKNKRKYEPLVIKNCVVPLILNKQLQKEYFHAGIPEFQD